VYFMNETWKWDDLRLFLAVARGNGLAKAAPLTRSSAPTLSRRMTALERALGRTLFLRHRNGYDLTQAGEELLGLAEAVEAGTLRIERWRSAEDPNPVVKIAAGVWTSAFLARHMAALVADRDALRVEILSGAAPADLLRREANLGLRNHRPETPGLAGRRVAHVAFAVYGETAYVRDRPEARDERRYAACRWIAFSPPGPKVPSAVWLEQQVHRDAWLTCSTAQAVLEAARAGAGLCVLPCFIGEAEAALIRASGPIEALGHDQWLVSHDEDRHSEPIRRVSDRLAKLVRTHEGLFAGRQPA
jgi:DNA-binding transcriptional LysR family regulator